MLFYFSSAADSASNSSVDGWEPQILTEVESSLDVAEVHQQHHIEDNFHFHEGHDVLRHPAQVICIKKVMFSQARTRMNFCAIAGANLREPTPAI